jgi:hypothetical protein
MFVRFVFASFLTILVIACTDDSTSAYMPSENALVLVRFEHLLRGEGIEFERGSDGMYSALDQNDMPRLIELGHQALDIEPSRGAILITSDCASEKLQSYLDAAHVFFVIRQEGKETYVELTESDYMANSITERYSSFEFDCSAALNKSELMDASRHSLMR